MTPPGPASATIVATSAVWGGASGLALVNHLMPPGATLGQFLVDAGISIFGAYCYQFIYTQFLRQVSADKGVPMEQRPKLDRVTLGYAMCGAPMATAALIYFIHALGGSGGLDSIPGFMAAGALGPQLVNFFLGAVKRLTGLKSGSAP